MPEKTYLDRVLCDCMTPVARVTLDHAPLNVLDRAMLEALDLCLADLESLSGLRCVILTGNGRAFAAGGDLAEYVDITPEAFGALLRLAHRVYARLERLPLPVIAAINGFAIGGGMELALACDIRLMAQSARISFPEASIGLMPSYGGTGRLSKLLGPGHAKYLTYSGRSIRSDTAFAMGLVQEVCADETLLTDAEALAGEIAGRSPAALRYIKRALHESLPLSQDDALALERDYAVQVCALGDVKEGIDAFVEKRSPRF